MVVGGSDSSDIRLSRMEIISACTGTQGGEDAGLVAKNKTVLNITGGEL